MVIISYIIKHIITNKNKILHKLFYALFAPYNKKKWKKYRICFRIHTEFYIYHLRKYRMNLRFTFYESLQAQCSKQEYKFVYKILYPIYSQSKKNDQKTDYRIITVSDRFHPSLAPFYVYSVLARSPLPSPLLVSARRRRGKGPGEILKGAVFSRGAAWGPPLGSFFSGR